jgi:hypothetical protein
MRNDLQILYHLVIASIAYYCNLLPENLIANPEKHINIDIKDAEQSKFYIEIDELPDNFESFFKDNVMSEIKKIADLTKEKIKSMGNSAKILFLKTPEPRPYLSMEYTDKCIPVTFRATLGSKFDTGQRSLKFSCAYIFIIEE